MSPNSRAQLRAAAASFARVFAAAAIACFLGLGHGVTDLDAHDVTLLVDAGAGAALITALNALRPGETRFGVGADAPAGG